MRYTRLGSLTIPSNALLSVSSEKKNKVKNAKTMRAARGQFEKLVRALVLFVSKHNCPSFSQVSTRIEPVEKVRSELYAAWTFTMHTCRLKPRQRESHTELLDRLCTRSRWNTCPFDDRFPTVAGFVGQSRPCNVYLSCCWLRLCLLSASSYGLLFPMSPN